MKNRLLKTGIGSLIFTFLIAFTFSMIHPVYSKVTSFVTISIDAACTHIREMSGYTFSYDSLSPSILSGINIKGIEVYDALTDKKIITVKKLVLSYSLFKLIRGDFSDCLNGITLHGVTIEYDTGMAKTVQAKIERDPNISENKIVSLDVSSFSPLIGKVMEYFPFYIHVKNVTVHIIHKDIDTYIALQRCSVTKNGTSSLGVSIAGRLSVKKADFSITSNLNSAVTVTRNLDDSTVRLYLTAISSKQFYMQRLNVLLSYSHDVILIKTLNNLFPLFFETRISLPDKKIDFSVKTQDLYPSQLAQIKTTVPAIKKSMHTRFSLSADGSYDINSGFVSYTSSGSIFVPDSLLPGSAKVVYDVSGDIKAIAIRDFEINGKNYDTSFTGVYDIHKKQPSGTANIRRVTLKNGNVLSGDVYIDALETGFVCFVPQLFLGEQVFTAVQLSVIPFDQSIDFAFEAYDYSHLVSDDAGVISEPGLLHVDGSYLLDTNYLQAGVGFSNFYIDSLVTTVGFPLKKNTSESLSRIANAVEPYIFSGDVYLASDLKTVTYNVPYSVIANTKRDGQILAFSLDGTDTSLQISRFDLVYGNLSLAMTAMADILPKTHEVFFTNDITINEIPYTFAGSISDKWIDISGDYGFGLTASYTPENIGFSQPFISGNLHVEDLPISLLQYTFALSTNITFENSSEDGFSCIISDFTLQEPSGKLSIAPKLDFAGEVNKYGAMLTSFSYTDTVSALNGTGNCLWNFNDSLFDSANISFTVSSLLSDEIWNLNGTVTNPSKKDFSKTMVKEDLYISLEAIVKHFPTSRFMKAQRPEDAINATIDISGTLDNPYVSLFIDHSSMSVLGAPLQYTGSGVLEDGVLHLADTQIKWVMFDISDLSAEYRFAAASGQASATVHTALMRQTIDMPIRIGFDSITNNSESLLPSSYIISLASDSITTSFLDKTISADFSLVRTDKRFDIYSSGDMSLSGYALDSGELQLTIGDGFPLKASVLGFMSQEGVLFQIDDIEAELENFSQFISLPFFSVYQGHIRGNVTVAGKLSDPDINGSMKILNPDFNLPIIIPDHFITQEMALEIKDNEVTLPETLFHVVDVPVFASLGISFDRWHFIGLDIFVHTDRNVYVPADVDLGDVHIVGQGSPDLQISVMADHAEVSGHIFAKNTTVDISPKAIAAAATAGSAFEEGGDFSIETSTEGWSYPLQVALDISMEQKVQVLIDPILRGVAAPNTELSMTFDSSENKLLLNSDITFRGGEIVYLNRNFYMKEGRIVFSDKQDRLDPYLTVRAETRERDEDGNQVTVILSADNALLSKFTPTFSAVPAKSEVEIMELLGQIMTADSTNTSGFLLAGGDYAMQITVMRKIENALRDLGNFDIFSIRTMVLQNAMKRSLSSNSENGSTNSLTIGNFFDNSTVYIGKYFSSELYTDALLHWTYDDTRRNDNDTVGGLVFQPEFGVELSSPFVNIRWSISPDLDSIKNNLWIPTTAVTLSWRFTF
ncbi:MAG: translocation/assembly module TamB [Treponema sp.]|nr:translocation/assembly module TamB [Treponema sp.]